MAKRLAALVLVLTLGGSVLAGIPLHSGGGESGMMDCCKKALEHSNSPSVSAARLCCAMNCNEPGSTSSNASQSFSQVGSEPTPAITVAPAPSLITKHQHKSRTPSISHRSNPAYILHLALLI